MDEREILRIAVRHDIDQYLTEALTLEFVRDVLKADRCTTPDRMAIIEECAKVCEQVAAARNIPEMRSGAELCVGAVRALKTAPTSDQGEKS